MLERHVLTVRPRRLAAPARQDTSTEHRCSLPPEVDQLCQSWAEWCRTRKYYAPDARLKSILGTVRTSRSTVSNAPAVFSSRDAAVFHQAVLCQSDERARQIFEAHFLLRVRPITKAAALVGVSRATWYYTTNNFAKRAYASYRELLEADPLN